MNTFYTRPKENKKRLWLWNLKNTGWVSLQVQPIYIFTVKGVTGIQRE